MVWKGIGLGLAAMVALAPLDPPLEEVPAPLLAKIIKVLAGKVGSHGRVSCSDARVGDELVKLGVVLDAESPVAWARTLTEVRALHATRKLIICGRLDFLPPGGCLAIVVEDERPAIYIHMRHIGQSKVLIPPELYDISTRISK